METTIPDYFVILILVARSMEIKRLNTTFAILPELACFKLLMETVDCFLTCRMAFAPLQLRIEV